MSNIFDAGADEKPAMAGKCSTSLIRVQMKICDGPHMWAYVEHR
jgi:hypothetical protein